MHIYGIRTHAQKKESKKKYLECNRFIKSSSPSTESFIALYRNSCDIFVSEESFKFILYSIKSVLNYSETENAKDINHFCCAKIYLHF